MIHGDHHIIFTVSDFQPECVRRKRSGYFHLSFLHNFYGRLDNVEFFAPHQSVITGVRVIGCNDNSGSLIARHL